MNGVFYMYKLLIVEDDMIIARTLKTHLQSWGFEVEYISDFQYVMT
jgi:two-component system, OmpR family, response regulator protein BraR/BceR